MITTGITIMIVSFIAYMAVVTYQAIIKLSMNVDILMLTKQKSELDEVKEVWGSLDDMMENWNSAYHQTISSIYTELRDLRGQVIDLNKEANIRRGEGHKPTIYRDTSPLSIGIVDTISGETDNGIDK